MAERDYIINARVNTGNSAKDLQDVNKAAQGVSQTTEKGAKSSDDYAKRLSAIKQQAQQGGQSIRDMSKIIKQYQSIAVEAGASSPIGRQAIEEAAVLRDRIDEVSLATRRLADDGANVKAALQLGTGVVQGYQGVLGVTTLLGVENENLIQTLTKLQAAQGVVNSLMAIQKALAKESELTLIAKNIGLKAQNFLLGQQAVVTEGATVATRALNVAMRALPILAIIAAVTALVTQWEKLKTALGFASESMKEFKETQAEAIKQTSDLRAKITDMSIAFDLAREGVIDKEKALKDYNDEFGETLGFADDLNEAEAIFNAKTKAYIQSATLRAQAQLLIQKAAEESNRALLASEGDQRNFVEETTNTITGINASLLDNFAFGLFKTSELSDKLTEKTKKNAEERVKTEAKAQEKLFTQKATDLLKEAALLDKQYDLNGHKRVEREKKTNTKIKKDNDERIKTQLKTEEDFRNELARLEDEYLNSQLDKQQQEINAVYDKYFAILEAAREAGEDTQLLEEAQLNALNEIRMKYAKIEQDEKDRLAEEDKARLQAQKDAELEYLNFRLNATTSTLDTLTSLANTFAGQTERGQKRAFNAQKALGIAQGLISTYQAAIEAYKSQLALGTPEAPIRAKIAAATATAAGLANVANIAKQQFNPQGGGAGVGGARPATGGEVGLANPQQQIQLFGQANEGSEIFAQNTTAQATNITVTAQVVETDMTATQNEVEGIQQLATL